MRKKERAKERAYIPYVDVGVYVRKVFSRYIYSDLFLVLYNLRLSRLLLQVDRRQLLQIEIHLVVVGSGHREALVQCQLRDVALSDPLRLGLFHIRSRRGRKGGRSKRTSNWVRFYTFLCNYFLVYLFSSCSYGSFVVAGVSKKKKKI